MLSMTNVGSVASAASYYSQDNYYTNDENKAMSAWEGKGAEMLGLSGEVDPLVFAEILSGKVGDAELGRIIGKGPDGELEREHRPGFDLTLSAPKSVSILAEVGELAGVREAHEAAVSKVLAYVEQNLVGARVTEAGETRFEKTGNVIAARFHHTTSRDLDPQTHTHLVIANATFTSNGQWRSISNELIYENQKLLGSIYDSELAANLVKLGFQLESAQNGRWEVDGISREQIDHFSQRSQAIVERLEKFGLTRETATAAQRESAALRTRDPKREVDHVALKEDWKDRAAAQGVDFQKIDAERQHRGASAVDAAKSESRADEAVKFAVAHLTERESVVDRREVLGVALDHSSLVSANAGVTIDAVEKSLEKAVSASQAIVPDEGRITTSQALDRENLMLSMLDAGKGAMSPVMDGKGISGLIAQFESQKSEQLGTKFELTVGQDDAARLALQSSDRFIALQGYAGVGKTTMLEVVRAGAEEAGYKIMGMASSASAAATLQAESGIESFTTARFLIDEGRRSVEANKTTQITVTAAIDMAGRDVRSLTIGLPAEPKERKEMWVVDEASLAGQREVSSLMEMAERAGTRVVFVGDKLQLNAVEAGKPFEILQRAGIASAEMTEINRQQVADLRAAVASAVQRDNAGALAKLAERVVEVPGKADLLDRIATDILAKHAGDRGSALIIVPRNDDRLTINDRVREGLQERGQIGKDAGTREVLVPTGFTDAQKASAAYYEKNMVVRFGRDYRNLSVERGEYATVVSFASDSRAIMLERGDGTQFAWMPEKHSKVEVYEQEKRTLAVGDEIRFTRNNQEMGVTNGTLAKVTEVTDNGVKAVSKNGEITLSNDQRKHGHWDYAYAMTVYASQGRTSGDASFLISKDSGRAMGNRSFYVGITRSKHDLTIYTDSKSKALDLITQAQNKTSATEELAAGLLKSSSRGDDDAGAKSAKGGSGGRGAGAEI